MGRKKRSSQNSNNIISHGDPSTSESESSKDSNMASEANKTACPHIAKSIEMSVLRKNLKINKDKNIHLDCWHCKKIQSAQCKDGWVCLRCGSCNCGKEEEDHRLDHYKTPRSDTHYIALQINTSIIWCFKCEQEIPVDVNKKVQSCADLVKKVYNDFSICSPGKVEVDKNGNDSTVHSKHESSLCESLQNISLNKSEIYPPSSLPKVRGLYNLGNTCFFNSVLQCLAQTPGLVDLLREMGIPGEKFHLNLDGKTIDAELEKPSVSAKAPFVLSEELAQILTEVSGTATNGDSRAGFYVVNPRRLLEALTRKCPQFEGGDQHDAHELLRHLLDSVHSEDLRRYQKAILNHIGYSKSLEDLDKDKKEFGKKLNQKVCDTIPIRPDQIFKGSLVSILQCTVCGHISKRDEPLLDLSLPVAQEKAQPPVVRRKQNCSSPVEEEQNTDAQKSRAPSKHQIKKAEREKRKMAKWKLQTLKNQNGNNTEQTQGEPTIEEEEDKNDSLDGDESDADVEDNDENVGEEHNKKTEIVESGYSSEKQMSARGSPITTQSPEDEAKPDFNQGKLIYPVYQGCEIEPETNKELNNISLHTATNSLESQERLLANRAESGLGSIQELTVTIPEETNVESTSQDSVHVNASNGSPDVSSDSQQGQFKTVDLTPISYNLPLNTDIQNDRRMMVQEWNCTGDTKTQSQGSGSVSLSVSPQGGSNSSQDNINRDSPKCSPKNSPLSGSQSNENMSLCNSLQHSNDNMSVCNSLPENISLLLNSPVKSQNSQKDENSGSEGRPESRMECKKNRSSPIEMGEASKLDSGLLKLSLEGVTYNRDVEIGESNEGTEENLKPIVEESPCKGDEAIMKADSSDLAVEITNNKVAIPLPPPLPLISAPYSFSHTGSSAQSNGYQKYRIKEGECSLQSCLNQFTTIEVLAGANKAGCEACTEKLNKGNKEGKTVYQNSTKQLLICKLPPVMIFHLKRFQLQRCSFRKISCHVDFPLVLDISQFCTRECNKNDEQMLYSLYGVVEHSGTLHGGHYVAYVKVRSHRDRRQGCPPPGKWYYVSDSHVRDVDESEVLKTQAYLLFYERIL